MKRMQKLRRQRNNVEESGLVMVAVIWNYIHIQPYEDILKFRAKSDLRDETHKQKQTAKATALVRLFHPCEFEPRGQLDK